MASRTIHDAVSADAPPEFALQKAYAYDGDNMVYEGWAAPGVATSASGWAIRKNTYSGSNVVATQWAGGNGAFANIWDNRASLSYS